MFIEPEDQEKQNQVNTPSIGSGAGAAGAAPSTGMPSTTVSVQPQQQEQKFASVQDYLKTNQLQGEQMANKFVSGLQGAADTQKSTIGKEAGEAKADIEAGATAFNPNIVAEAKATPTSVAGDEAKLSDFLKQWNASYTGPQSLETSQHYTEAAKAAQEAKDKSEQLKTTGGREQLIQDTFNVYGQGNKGLDQALLQQSSAFPTIQSQVQPQFASIADYLTAQSGEVSTAAQDAAAKTQAAKDTARGAFEGALTDFQGDLNTRVSEAQKTASDLATKYQDDLRSGDSSKIEADLKAAGIPDKDTVDSVVKYLKIINSDYQAKPSLGNYYTYNPATDVNPQTVATQADYDKAQALQKLTGVDYSGVLSPADVSKAGTWNQADKGFQTGAMADYLKGNVQQRDKEVLSGMNIQPNILAVAKDPAKSAQLASKYISVGKRAGMDFSNPATVPPVIDTFIRTTVANYVNQAVNGWKSGQRNPDPGLNIMLEAFVTAGFPRETLNSIITDTYEEAQR